MTKYLKIKRKVNINIIFICSNVNMIQSKLIVNIFISTVHLSSVKSLSCVQLFVTPWIAACQALLSSAISQSLLIFMSTGLVMLSNYLILCHPLLLLPSIFPSIRVFSNESVLCIRWLKNWSFSISPSSDYQGWFPLGLTGLIPLQSKGLSRVFSNTTGGKHQSFNAQSSLWSKSHTQTWLLERPY